MDSSENNTQDAEHQENVLKVLTLEGVRTAELLEGFRVSTGIKAGMMSSCGSCSGGCSAGNIGPFW